MRPPHVARALMGEFGQQMCDAVRQARAEDVVPEDPLVQAVRLRSHFSAGQIPSLVDLSNPQVVKDPYMWLLLLEAKKVTKSMIRGPLGTRGAAVQAFEDACREQWSDLDAEQLRKLSALLIQVSNIYLNHQVESGVEDLMKSLEVFCSEARNLIVKLDGAMIGSTVGEPAGTAYKNQMLFLSAERFPVAAGEALKKAAFKAAQKTEGGQANRKRQRGETGEKGDRTCKKCGKEVPWGTKFKDHKKTCSK